jgi:hypothetical protein
MLASPPTAFRPPKEIPVRDRSRASAAHRVVETGSSAVSRRASAGGRVSMTGVDSGTSAPAIGRTAA